VESQPLHGRPGLSLVRSRRRTRPHPPRIGLSGQLCRRDNARYAPAAARVDPTFRLELDACGRTARAIGKPRFAGGSC
jgi:hypothetical protein